MTIKEIAKLCGVSRGTVDRVVNNRGKVKPETEALILSAIACVLAAFFQITGVITVTTAFLWVVFGIAVGYLGVLVAASALRRCADASRCLCPALQVILTGILGALLAQQRTLNAEPLPLMQLAAYLHAAAAIRASEALGEYCVTPEDVVRSIRLA